MYDCACPMKEGMSFEELKAIVPDSCSYKLRHPYICPNLVKELKRAETDERAKSYRSKKLKQEGYTDEEIQKKTRRNSSKKANKVVNLDEVL